jgi:hypothetical protein
VSRPLALSTALLLAVGCLAVGFDTSAQCVDDALVGVTRGVLVDQRGPVPVVPHPGLEVGEARARLVGRVDKLGQVLGQRGDDRRGMLTVRLPARDLGGVVQRMKGLKMETTFVAARSASPSAIASTRS